MTNTGQTTSREVLQRAEQLALKIRQERGESRLSLRPEFSRLLNHLRIEGIPVSRRLRQLDEELCEQDLESRFDNMPV
jgi:Ser/Thr protein kinase RdoA (MazF antagonist)